MLSRGGEAKVYQMRCRFVVQVDMHEPAVPESEKHKLVEKVVKNSRGEDRTDHFFPAGTEYEHPDAWRFVNFGMADAVDDECKAMAKPLSDAERKMLQKRYAAASAGVHDQDDVQLFLDDKILGYRDVDGQTAYIPGPRWAEHEAELEATQKKDEGI